ncbi:hypothetical protein LTR17_016064 [Elasticomyces elasticus]|nr:hypothetical protein LTR17_016064 [Elasticomyces elasticus]
MYRARGPPNTAELFAAKQSLPQDTLGPDALQLQQELQSSTADPAATLRERMQAGTADIQTARVYFDRLRKLRRRERREQVERDSIGRLTLTWLWSEDRRWVGAVLQDPDMCEMLVYFVAAEKLDNLLLRWIQEPLASTESVSDHNAHAWRGLILRRIVGAHLYLEFEGRADAALTLFFSIASRVKVERRRASHSPLSCISLWPAEVEICKSLLTGRFSNTNHKLYDRFRQHIAGQRKANPWTLAQLYLNHPLKPDPGPACALVKERLHGLTPADYRNVFPSGGLAGKSIYFGARRIEDLLRDQGKIEDADQIDTLLGRLMDDKERLDLEDKWWREKALKRALKNGWAKRSGGPSHITRRTTAKGSAMPASTNLHEHESRSWRPVLSSDTGDADRRSKP